MRPFDPRLLTTVPQTRRPLLVLAVIGVANGLAAVGQAFAIAWTAVGLVTVIDGRRPADALTGAVVWLAAAAVVRAVLAWGNERAAVWAGTTVSGALRAALARRWLTGPDDGRQPGRRHALATQGMTDIEPYVARYLPAMVAGAVLPVLVVGVLFVTDWVSGVIVLVTLPLLPVFAALIGWRTQDEMAGRRADLARLAGHFSDVMRGLPTLVGYGRSERQLTVIAAVSRRHRESTVRTLRLAFASTAALDLLATISVAMVAVACGLRLAYGAMPLSVALLAILLAPEAYWPIRRMGSEFHNAAAGADALTETLVELDRPLTVAAGDHSDQVQVCDLSVGHPGNEVLTGVTFVAGRGLTALTGRSGVGKSTLLDVLAGIRPPLGGTVGLPGRPLLVRQDALLLPGTLRDNLALGSGAGDDQIWAALRRVGLDGFVAALPGGLSTVIGDAGRGLSAGQRARTALARAWLTTAEVVLLDEPSAHVDPAAAAELHAQIAELARTRIVVAVTHRHELAEQADAVIDLDRFATPRPEHRPPHGRRGAPARPAEQSVAAGIRGERMAANGPDAAVRDVPDRVSAWRRLWLPGVLCAGATAFGASLTATSGWLIVQASYRPIVLTLLVAIVGVRTFGIGRPVLRYAERLLAHSAALDELAQRRVDTYRRLIPLTPARLGRRRHADVLDAVVADLDDEVLADVRSRVPLLGTAATAVVAAGFALAISWPAGLVVTATLALCLAGAWLQARALSRAGGSAVVAARGAVAGEIDPITTDAAGLYGLGAEDQMLARVARAQVALTAALDREAGVRGLAAGWQTVVPLVGACAAALVLATSGLSAPVAVAVMLIPVAMAEPVSGLVDAASSWARSRAAGGRVDRLLAGTPAVAEPKGTLTAASDPALELRDVRARWTDDGRVVGPHHLTAPAGRHIAIVGANGSGKSTMLAVIARWLDPLTGTYEVSGLRHDQLDLTGLRSRFAIVDDQPHLFAASLRDNLLLARPEATDAELLAALDQAGLAGFVAGLPYGAAATADPLAVVLGDAERGRGVSGGERARIALARALVSRRPVVLLDEPVAHLDHPTAVAVLEAAQAACVDRTLVMVTHRTDGLDRFDHVLDLDAPGRASAPVVR